jgi:hypothetical protein
MMHAKNNAVVSTGSSGFTNRPHCRHSPAASGRTRLPHPGNLFAPECRNDRTEKRRAARESKDTGHVNVSERRGGPCADTGDPDVLPCSSESQGESYESQAHSSHDCAYACTPEQADHGYEEGARRECPRDKRHKRQPQHAFGLRFIGHARYQYGRLDCQPEQDSGRDPQLVG